MPVPARQQPSRPDRRRHLLDPGNLHQSHVATQSSTGELTHVQQWVMSVLAVTTILHLAAGLALAAVFLDGADRGGRIGLNVIAGVVGVLAVASGFAIHRRSPLTPWLVLGIIPGLVGAYFTFR